MSDWQSANAGRARTMLITAATTMTHFIRSSKHSRRHNQGEEDRAPVPRKRVSNDCLRVVDQFTSNRSHYGCTADEASSMPSLQEEQVDALRRRRGERTFANFSDRPTR